MLPQRGLPYLVGALLGLALGLGALLFGVLRERPGSPADSAVATGVADSLVAAPVDVTAHRHNAIVEATRRVSPSVVSINALRRQVVRRYQSPADQLLELFFGQRRGRSSVEWQNVGLGSGFVVDHRGYILTNHHVVAGGEEIVVTLGTGEQFAADLIGASSGYDLALVKIQGEVSGLPVAELGNSDEVEIGEWAIAMGSPFGYLLEDPSPSVTVGVVSASHRDVKPQEGQRVYYDMIQTDAAINPGNSGGPLVDSRGRVIGINTFIISESGGSVGIGFAVPINRGRWVMEEIFNYGRFRAPYAGMDGEFLTTYVRRGMQLSADVPSGWLVESVDQGSPADVAGILPRDVVVAVNGARLANDRSLLRLLYDARVGTGIDMEIWRAGRTFESSLTLVEHPD